MKSYVTLLFAAALIALVAGCAKKPKVEPMTPPTTAGTTTTPADTSKMPITPPPEVTASEKFEAIYFDFDKYNLRPDALADMKKNVQVMKDEPDLKIRIEGNCDERGTIEYNLALGERRAKAARDYLVSSGIDGSRISVISYGKERPKALGHDEESWQENRRDDFVEL